MGWGWEEAKKAKLSVAPILAYWQAVRAETHAYVTGLAQMSWSERFPFSRASHTPWRQCLRSWRSTPPTTSARSRRQRGSRGPRGCPINHNTPEATRLGYEAGEGSI